jgi:threonine/homoserine/homoserine lactone efflux protein
MLIVSAALLGLLIGFIGSIPLAGPIALLVLRKGVEKRYAQGAAIALGAAIPEAIYCGLAFLGFDFLFARYTWVEPTAKLLGALLMLVLGTVFIFSRPKKPAADASTGATAGNWAASFLSGFSISAINPVLIITWTAVATVVFSLLGGLGLYGTLAFSAMVGVGIFAWFGVMLLLMRRFHHNFRPETLAIVVRVFGGLIVALGLWLGYGAILLLVQGRG